jgi:hypothetical protein
MVTSLKQKLEGIQALPSADIKIMISASKHFEKNKKSVIFDWLRRENKIASEEKKKI